jgi:hypothetical protein
MPSIFHCECAKLNLRTRICFFEKEKKNEKKKKKDAALFCHLHMLCCDSGVVLFNANMVVAFSISTEANFLDDINSVYIGCTLSH